MNLLNLFEDDSRTPNPNYAEELAYQIFKAAPNLDTTGAADEVLDYAFDLAVNDLGRKRAHSLFAYDEDFDSDLVNAYLDLQMNKSAEDKKQVNEIDPRNFDSDEDYYAALNAPAKRRRAPSDYPYSQEEDDAYFREIFRKKREAAKKAEQDKGSLTEFAEKPENGPGSDEYEDLLFHLAWEIWSEAGDSAQAERKLSLLGWKPEFGDDYTAMVLYKIGSNDHRQYTIDEFEEYGGSGDEDLDESRMSELDAEYQDYKKLSPREFFNMYRITKQAWLAKYKSMLPVSEADAQVNGRDVNVGVVVSKLKKFVANAEQQLQNADYDQQRQYATTVRDRALKALEMIKQGGNTPEAASAAFKYMQTGKQGTVEGQKWPDTTASLAQRKVVVPNLAAYRAGETGGTKAGRPGGMTVATRVDPSITPTSVKKLGSDRPVPSFLQKGVAEADKKKEDELEPQIKDVALQRAITRAKADFPAAGSGIEALAKDFMRSQDQDSKSFDQLRQAERKQDQMLGQIAKIDQEQEQEIKGLENQNSTLASRLQQLQNVNGELEKKLAAMSGRRAEKKSNAIDGPIAPAPASTTPTEPIKPKTKAKSKVKSQPTKSSMKSIAAPSTISNLEPGANAFSKMTPALAAAGNPQQSLFPSDYGKDSADLAMQQIRKNALASKNAGAQDVPFRDVQDTDSLRKIAQQELGVQENNDQEAKYSDKYQDMVARVGQKAREQEKSKPVDIKDLARRLAAIEASRKD